MAKIIDLRFQGNSDTIAAFLLESSEGPVLIETGPHSTYEMLCRGLRCYGYAPEDVRHVFLTHIHLDHAGAAWVFAGHGANIYLHPLGRPHLEQPEKLLESARRIYKENMDPLWGTLRPIPAGRLQAIGHLEEVRIGDRCLRALHTPGHAVHHIAWQVGRSLFTGDAAGICIPGNALVQPPCPPPDIDLAAWQQSIALMRQGGFERLYLTHFGEVSEVADHLDRLERRLLDWAQWIKPFYERGEDAASVVPQFQAFVREELAAAGISAADMVRYEFANPSWMSVSGLMRYWRKMGS
jgi:glyoxylase-like metal-dependent hydrolase (beta-lactamase superfamily II)